MSKDSGINSSGITFFGAMALVFITSKLLHMIDWSWGWVLAPIWIPIVVFLMILGTIFGLGAVMGWREK